MTSSFTSMALAALAIAACDDLEGLRADVRTLCAAADRLLDELPAALQRLAAERHERAVFLGSGALRAIAGEASLKLLELTAGRVATLHESFLGVRHGPLAVVNARTLLVGFLSSNAEERALELNLIAEVRQKGLAGRIALVVPEADERAAALADEVLLLPLARDLRPGLRPLLDALVAQILALFASLEHGLLPDSPSPNGAIQRVVSGLAAR